MAKGSVNKEKSRRENLQEAVALMKVLAHPLRLAILCALIHNGEMTAGQIVAAHEADFSQSQVSQYLGILRDMGYVKTRRDAQVIWYAISDANVKKIVQSLYSIYCDGAK